MRFSEPPTTPQAQQQQQSCLFSELYHSDFKRGPLANPEHAQSWPLDTTTPRPLAARLAAFYLVSPRTARAGMASQYQMERNAERRLALFPARPSAVGVDPFRPLRRELGRRMSPSHYLPETTVNSGRTSVSTA